MTPTEVRKQWVEALRSGKYKQSTTCLKSKKGYCCLGVLCELAVEAGIVEPTLERDGQASYNGYTHFLPPEVKNWVRLKERCGCKTRDERDATALWCLNDAGKTFTEIADIIESDDEYFQNTEENT